MVSALADCPSCPALDFPEVSVEAEPALPVHLQRVQVPAAPFVAGAPVSAAGAEPVAQVASSVLAVMVASAERQVAPDGSEARREAHFLASEARRARLAVAAWASAQELSAALFLPPYRELAAPEKAFHLVKSRGLTGPPVAFHWACWGRQPESSLEDSVPPERGQVRAFRFPSYLFQKELIPVRRRLA